MKKILLVLCVIFICTTVSLETFAALDWDRYSKELPPSTPREITVDRNTYEFNPHYWESRGLIVYGNFGNIKPNDQDKYGQWRYLGFEKSGNKFSNSQFKDDYVTNIPPEQQHWLYEPWRWGLCKSNDWSTKTEYAADINNGQEFPILNGLRYDGTEWGTHCSITTRFGYGLVQSYPTLDKPGSFRMWHKEKAEDITPAD